MSDGWEYLFKLGAEHAQMFLDQCAEDERRDKEISRINALKAKVRQLRAEKDHVMRGGYELMDTVDKLKVKSQNNFDKANFNAIERNIAIISNTQLWTHFINNTTLNLSTEIARGIVYRNIIEAMAVKAGFDHQSYLDLQAAIGNATNDMVREFNLSEIRAWADDKISKWTQDVDELAKAAAKQVKDAEISHEAIFEPIRQNRKSTMEQIVKDINKVVYYGGPNKLKSHDDTTRKICTPHIDPILTKVKQNASKQDKVYLDKIAALEDEVRKMRSENAIKSREISSLTQDLAHHMAQSAAFRQQLSISAPTNPLITDAHLRQRVATMAYDKLASSDFKDWAVVKQVGETFMEPEPDMSPDVYDDLDFMEGKID